jgi:hypothetical protein
MFPGTLEQSDCAAEIMFRATPRHSKTPKLYL